MARKQGIAVLGTGALILLALLTVFAIKIADNQSNSRRQLEVTAHQRAQLVAGLIDTVFQATSKPDQEALAQYGGQIVPNEALEANRGDNLFVALLGTDGSVIAHSTGFDAQARATLRGPGAVATVRAGRAWSLGNVSPYGPSGVVDFATLLQTAAGPRILVTGFPPASLSTFISAELHKIPGVQGNHSLLVDSNGVVIASTNPLRPPGYRFHTKAQIQALTHRAGIVKTAQGTKYFDQVSLPSTRMKIILSAPANEFFAPVSGFRHWLPWTIFSAFGLVALAALALIARTLRDAERVRVANTQLTDSNAELSDAQGRLEELNGTLEVTNSALNRTNEELERQAHELVRSNTELDQFASIASHDLQEPLRKVRTFTERVTETEAERLSERGVDYLRRANASAERMQTLIEDLLRFSRVSTQGRPFAPVDLDQVVRGVLDDLSEQVRRHHATVEVQPLPTISADAPQMRQLMQNLISNALKFRREGVIPEVRIAAHTEPGWTTITVVDNGIGFDPQYARRIFRVFERLHGRGAYPGTGIGLALCRKIAERHGGTIIADSMPGEGATFTITLQTERSEAVSDAPALRTQTTTSEEPYVPA